MDGPTETVERITAIYRVLKPHLATVYERHLAVANPVYEPPTRRILARCLEEERRHAAAGVLVLGRLIAADPTLEMRAKAWERQLLSALTEAGGVTGDVEAPLIVPPALMPDPAVVAQDIVALPPAFNPHAVLGDLAVPLEAHRRALARGDLATVRAELAPGAAAEMVAGYARLPSPIERVEVVGCARLGHQRMVKLRVVAAQVAIVLQERWVIADGGWRIAAVEATSSTPAAVVLGTVLVANRGEIARRVFRACRRAGVATVAVFSEADREAPHVREADRSALLGGAPARESYLDIERILDAARRTGADAVHPGYGFLSENWRFAEACARAGLTFIGPPAEAIRAMGDKTEARRLMAAAGVPTVPGSPGPVADPAEAEAAAAAIGLPLIIKAAGGGGGIGMARVDRGADLAAAFATATRRAQSAFGNPAVYLERYLERPRHVEVQVFADAHGGVVHLHERECSIQRRHQKLVEESPAPGLDPATKRGLTEAAVAGARAIGYVNAGTMEFLVDAAGRFYFLEMNTRIQVEHPVTEEVTGLDLVVEQLRVAAGERLSWRQEAIVQSGAAVEVRAYAEDPDKNFLPSPGTIARLELPAGEGIRVESGVESGSVVSVHYDPLLFKLIARGGDRDEALARMRGAIAATRVEGVKSTLPFLTRVLEHPDVRRGLLHTQMVDQGAFR